jgi:hypothetical protein
MQNLQQFKRDVIANFTRTEFLTHMVEICAFIDTWARLYGTDHVSSCVEAIREDMPQEVL